VAIRPAHGCDAQFLTLMLVAAAFWRPDGPAGSVEDALLRPELAHYVAGWPAPGDLGVIALDDAQEPVGAAWLRYLRGDDAGYGYVDDATPELTIGVAADHRWRGIGAQLMDALTEAARAVGIGAISLSVEPDNYAMRLYQRHGFAAVARSGGSVTMLRTL
jgi:ribosomal protein S18 acetylase RimI-like enzyme